MGLKPLRKQDLLLVGVPKVFNGAATLFISILLVRVLGPAEYGLVGLCLTYLMLIDALMGAAIDLGIVGRISVTTVQPALHPLEVGGLAWKVILGTGIWLILTVSGTWIGTSFFMNANAGRTLQLWAVAATVMLIVRSLQLYLQVRGLFGWHGVADCLHTLLRLLFLGYLSVIGRLTPSWIMAAYIAAGGVVLLSAAASLRGRLMWSHTRLKWPSFLESADSAKPALVNFGLSAVVSRMDLLFVAVLAGPIELGIYSAALTLAMIPEIAASYVSPALLPRIQPACREGSIYGLLRGVNAYVYAVCAVSLVAGVLLGPTLIRSCLGTAYSRSALLFPVLYTGTIAVSSIFPMTLNVLLLRRPRIPLKLDLLVLPVLAAGYWLFIPAHGIFAAAALTAAYRITRAVYLQYQVSLLIATT